MPGGAEIALNVDGLGDQATLGIELLDDQFRPLPGHAGDSRATAHQPGLRQTIAWSDGRRTVPMAESWRVRVHSTAKRPAIFASTRLYVRPSSR